MPDAGHPWGLLGIALLVLLVLAAPVAKALRRRRRRRATPATARFVGGWAEVLDLARDLGRDVPDGLPRTEQALRLGLSVDLARAADVHVFAREEPTATDADAFWTAVRAERRRQLREARVLRHVLAPWAPASLLDNLRGSLRTSGSRWRRAGRRGPWRRAASPGHAG